MKSFRTFLFACCGTLLVVSSTIAAEPAQDFLDTLREKDYHDMALVYLDKMSTSDLVTNQFKNMIGYNKAIVLIEMSRTDRNTKTREAKLDQAQQLLEKFRADFPNNNEAMAASNQLGNLLVERARIKVQQAKETASTRDKLNQDARDLYLKAETVFEATREKTKEILETRYGRVLDPKRDKILIDQRNKLRTDYLQSQLLVAALSEEIADTFKPDSKEFTDRLTKAAKEYGAIYDKYRTRLAGLYARLYEARALQRLGKHDDAIAIFNELLDNPDDPAAFRTLKIKVFQLAAKSWLAKKQYSVVVDKMAQFVTRVSTKEGRLPEWLELKLRLAEAHKLLADQLAEKNPTDKQVKISRLEAKKLAFAVAREPGDFQSDARKLLADLPNVALPDEDEGEPTTFAEAREAGKEGLDLAQTARQSVALLTKRLATTKDEANKAEIAKQLEAAKANIPEGTAQAIDNFQLALELADENTSIEDLNIVQYFLSYLHYSEGNFYEAATIGKFVAERYPGSSGARQCAKIAMASWIKVYSDAKANNDPDLSFEQTQVVSVAEYIADRWPNEPEAGDAINTLIPFAIREGELDKALGYLKLIPEDSLKRGQAELKTGQAFWGTFLQGSADVRKWENEGVPEGEDIAAKKAELEDLKQKAQSTLADGVTRMRERGKISQTLATAVLSLSQIYVDTGQADKAVALLEDERIGALTLAKANSPAIAEANGYTTEAYKTALRAYVSTLAEGDSDATIKKAKEVMAAMKAELSGPDGEKRLVSTYINLAQDLRKQMDIASGPTKQALANGFEAFLGQVSADSSDLNVLQWVGETFYNIGGSFAEDPQTEKSAKPYFEKAIATYERILAKDAQDPKFIDDGLEIQTRMRIAQSKRNLGGHEDYKAAINAFEEILKKKPMMLNVQVEAAHTYQQWAKTGKADLYKLAMGGARPGDDKKNVIWGWGKISQLTARNEAFSSTFHESRYNLALCRFRYAEKETDAKKKLEYMKQAQRDIEITYKLYPNMGGKEFFDSYDKLLKNVQKAVGQSKPQGIAALKAEAETSGP